MKIGFTGHQNLDKPIWVKSKILQFLRQEKEPIIGITSLAIGADQLFANSVLECDGTLVAIIPFEKYAETFQDHDLFEYKRLLKLASSTEILHKASSNQESYLAAGKRVVDLSELLLTIWNGKPAAGLGGTGDIVEYARQKKKKYIQINPDSQEILTYL